MAGPRGEGCPVCGGEMGVFAGACPTCGYAIRPPSRSVKVTTSSTDPPSRATTGSQTDSPRAPDEGDQTGPCATCGGRLPVDARYCRHCGASVREWRFIPAILMILGFCLTASIIGAVLGIPLQLLALRLFRESREATVVGEASSRD